MSCLFWFLDNVMLRVDKNLSKHNCVFCLLPTVSLSQTAACKRHDIIFYSKVKTKDFKNVSVG